LARAFHQSWKETDWPCNFYDFGTIGRPTAVARNTLVRQARGTHADRVLFIDDDQAWTPNTVRRLLDNDLDIVGAWSGARYAVRPTTEARIPACVFEERDGQMRDLQPQDGGLQEVDAIGFAMVAIKRKVFEVLEEPWFRTMRENGGECGEEISFCERARKAGFKVWVDWGLPLWHQLGGAGSYAGQLSYR